MRVRKLNLNSVSFGQLLRHPYMAYDQVQILFRYRGMMGGFKSVNDLIDNELSPDSTLVKIKPYLYWEPSASGGAEK